MTAKIFRSTPGAGDMPSAFEFLLGKIEGQAAIRRAERLKAIVLALAAFGAGTLAGHVLF